MKNVPRQLLWETQRRGERLSSKITSRFPPKVSDYILHRFERVDTFEELDLSIESWRTSEVQMDTMMIEESSTVTIPSSGPLPKESHSWKDLYVRCLDNVSLDVDSGLVFARDRVITQSGGGARSARDAAFISGASARYRLKSVTHTNFPVAPVGDTWHHYHFLVETLPRLLHINSIHSDVRFVSSQTMSPAAAECLELLGIQVIQVERNALIRASKVIICDSPAKFWPRKTDILTVRQALLSKVALKTSKNGEISYISRLNSDRSPLGENELELALTRVGARILHLEKISLREQIRAVLNTSTIIGPHGAGLSAIMFMDPGQRIIEMSSGDRFESCYRRMASLLDLKYQYMDLEGDPNSPNGAFTSRKIHEILEAVS